jgi:hypothetical protein
MSDHRVVHCDRCGIGGYEGVGIDLYRGVPYCDRCALIIFSGGK